MPEGVQSAATAVTADAGLATKVAPVMDISIPMPASAIRFPTISTAATAAAVPVAAVVAAAAAVEITVPAAAPAVTPFVGGKESMMREMLLKKRQGGAMGGKLCLVFIFIPSTVPVFSCVMHTYVS